jgi:hypothetical protein
MPELGNLEHFLQRQFLIDAADGLLDRKRAELLLKDAKVRASVKKHMEKNAQN